MKITNSQNYTEKYKSVSDFIILNLFLHIILQNSFFFLTYSAKKLYLPIMRIIYWFLEIKNLNNIKLYFLGDMTINVIFMRGLCILIYFSNHNTTPKSHFNAIAKFLMKF